MLSQVIGNGPIGFTDSNGNQRFIPLSVLEFSNGQINASKWSLYAVNQTVVDSLLKELVDNDFLRPGSSPPLKPAIVLKAAVPGAAGNNIRVAFSELKVDTTTPANTTFKAKITAKDTYPGLSYDSASAAFIKKILGTATVAGEKPCLIRVKDADPPSQPKEGSYSLTGGNATTKSSKGIDGDSTETAFTTEAWKAGSEGDSITVTISQVNATQKTFTLGVELKQPTIADIKLSDLPTKLAGSGIVLTLTKPDGGDFAVPALGTVGLSGGSDAKAAASASAIIVAKT
jgi:hypothetical protein